MKKTLSLLLALTGVAAAAPIINPDGSVNVDGSTYAYLWSGEGANANFTTAENWKYLPSPNTSGSLSGSTPTYYPNGTNDAFIGYDYDSATGVFTKNQNAITVTDWKSTYAGDLFLGDNTSFSYSGYQRDMTAGSTIHLGNHSSFTITGGDAGIKAAVTFDLGSVASYTGAITVEGTLWLDTSSRIAFTGSYTLDGAFFQKQLMTVGSINFSGDFTTLIDGSGLDLSGFENAGLEYAGVIGDVSELQDNQYALLWQNNAVSLVARDDSFQLVPEPATAALGLLGLAALACRRRR